MKGYTEGWFCSNCKLYNDILTNNCKACHNYKPDWITGSVQAVVEIRRDCFLARLEPYDMNTAEIRALINSIKLIDEQRLKEIGSEIEETEDKEELVLKNKISEELLRRTKADNVITEKIQSKGMNPQEELFARFYSEERILIKDMDILQLREHREMLSKIAFEAKARLVASDDEGRERNARNNKGKEWLLSSDNDTSQATSDALTNAVKSRTARLSKMDKVKRDLLAAGIDEDTVNEMVRNLERKATETQVKTITFNKPSVETGAVTVQVSKPVAENVEPFNPANLSFGK